VELIAEMNAQRRNAGRIVLPAFTTSAL